MIKRVVIVGHTGFIGSKIESTLRKNYPALEIMGFSYPSFDLVTEAERLKTYFDEYTGVVMLAAVKKQLGDTLENFQTNINLITAFCKVLSECKIQRVLYFSSAAVYGESIPHTIISENTALQPQTYYGIAKYASEKLLLRAAPAGLVILRPAVIYGPGDMAAYGPSGFLQMALADKEVVLWGDGMEKREFIFVEDVALLVEKILFSDYTGILNVASGKSYSYREILEVIREKTSLPLKIRSRERTNEKVDHYFNNGSLRKQFPAFEFTSLSQGIQKMMAVLPEGVKNERGE